MKRIPQLLLLLIILFHACKPSTEKDFASWVDPFIGTGGHGHTYPGVCLPFGMVQASPDTRLEGWDGCSGYHYSDSVIYGFSHTHLSGTGASDYGDLLLMPLANGVKISNESAENGYPSYFNKGTEKASPGYYSVILQDEDVTAEITGTVRTAMHRYTYPEEKEKGLLIDLKHRDRVLDSHLEMVSDTELVGWRISTAWAAEQHLYFCIRFSQSIQGMQLFLNDTLLDADSVSGLNVKGFVSLEKGLQPLVVKVGISGVDIEGARKNLDAESPGWDFDATRMTARDEWNNVLSRIKVKTDNKKNKRVFYTALYHAYLAPNIWSDVDGRYRGRDMQIHHTDGVQYTVFSLWDTYRTEHPLFTILEPERTKDFLETFLRQFQEGGRLPVWELAANETECMIGYHSVSVIADAYAKGLFNQDKEALYNAMKASAMGTSRGLLEYRQGYIPFDKEGESVSKTLEYGYDDWCIAQVAKMLGKQDDYEYFMKRSQSYRNLFDPSTGFLRARSDAFWFKPFDPAEVNFNYTEANAWQYSFYVPQDVSGFMGLLGGPDSLVNRLDQLFNVSSQTTGREQADITGLIGQYAHGNEPSHHMAYLYAYAGRPDRTQYYVRRILEEMYSDQPDGLSGNEDCGQMSAWYVMSALGFYPVAPGKPEYVIGSPLFERVEIDLGNGKTLTIQSKPSSKRSVYISSAWFNGESLDRCYLSHDEIMNGGDLCFRMNARPGDWGKNGIPVNSYEGPRIVPVPILKSGDRIFRDSTVVALECSDPQAKIFYTTNIALLPEEWTEYSQSFVVKENTGIWAYAISRGQRSLWMSGQLDKLPEGRTIKLGTEYAPQYSAGGDDALIDMIRGGKDFKTGAWQGYQSVNLEAIVDLGKITPIKEVTIGFLQDARSWIFMPLRVNIHISQDGVVFKEMTSIENVIPEREMEATFTEFQLAVSSERARFVKVEAINRGVCPPWHLGAGGGAWIFADEITIR